ncbi:hypothetical protein QBC34DRAFT_95995 [Podospora aff. communis PSN243]|uniref:Uncharacterized protein n=1 Tax=Podospora aff. communis PSN243 TaxID=3040156 RepID=A0AAV9GPH8_9PEZI|nr:hypothetical protein QBC34DRAFT_95995 [Podospora aff. communis PSN243]
MHFSLRQRPIDIPHGPQLHNPLREDFWSSFEDQRRWRPGSSVWAYQFVLASVPSLPAKTDATTELGWLAHMAYGACSASADSCMCGVTAHSGWTTPSALDKTISSNVTHLLLPDYPEPGLSRKVELAIPVPEATHNLERELQVFTPPTALVVPESHWPPEPCKSFKAMDAADGTPSPRDCLAVRWQPSRYFTLSKCMTRPAGLGSSYREEPECITSHISIAQTSF